MSSQRDFKQKLLTCLTKLSDRDTHTSAATELEKIAQNLTNENISAFISSITVTNSLDRSPVRKQCMKLISTVACTHGDILTSSLEWKLINAVIRRLRDNDTSVRAACVAAVFSIATHANKPFTTVCKPLVEALVTEQEVNAQIGAAMCLAAAVEGAKEVDVVYLRRILVRVEKLLKGEGFKAKSALLGVLGSVIGVRGVVCEGVDLKDLVFVLVEYVKSSEEWSVRKSAAECLEKLAVVEGGMLVEFKASCLKTFEAKKFDKVKSVRETMIQMIEAWKGIPDVGEEEVLSRPESQSSSKVAEVASDGRYPPRNQILANKKTVPNRSPTKSATRRTSLENRTTKTGSAMFRKLDRKKRNVQKLGTAAPRHESIMSVDNDDHTKNRFARPETKRALFNDIVDEEEVYESEYQNARLSSTVVGSNTTEDIHKCRRDTEELSLIRNQLVQIETQQSNLVDLLQKFIGSSQTGMQSLETRVHGLELTLDEISFGLARSTGRLSHPGPTETLCCKLPGADFLTSRLWKKTELQHLNIKISAPFAATTHMTGKNMSLDSCNPENRGFRRQGVGSGLIKNPLAEVHRNAHGISGI